MDDKEYMQTVVETCQAIEKNVKDLRDSIKLMNDMSDLMDRTVNDPLDKLSSDSNVRHAIAMVECATQYMILENIRGSIDWDKIRDHYNLDSQELQIVMHIHGMLYYWKMLVTTQQLHSTYFEQSMGQIVTLFKNIVSFYSKYDEDPTVKEILSAVDRAAYTMFGLCLEMPKAYDCINNRIENGSEALLKKEFGFTNEMIENFIIRREEEENDEE